MLPLLLFLALIHALLYLVIVPPWQHYDEPTHFEYVRLIMLWERQPALNEFDLTTNREIADSMYRFRFWSPSIRPSLVGSRPQNIGFDEKIHPPLYYSVAAVPVRLLRYLSVEQQLYAARSVAVLFYLLVVLCAWRITTIVTPDSPFMQLIIPLLVIFVPAFSDQMSAVNNDLAGQFQYYGSAPGLCVADPRWPAPYAAVAGYLGPGCCDADQAHGPGRRIALWAGAAVVAPSPPAALVGMAGWHRCAGGCGWSGSAGIWLGGVGSSALVSRA